MFYVNRTKSEQGVYGPGRQLIWLKPGEGVEGEHWEQYSKVTAKNGPLTPEEKTTAKIIGRPAGDQAAAAVAAVLDANPALAAAVDAKRDENAEAKADAKAKEAPRPAPAPPSPKK